MQTLQLRSRTAPDGTITLQLPPELANQDFDFTIVCQSIAPTQPLTEPDPLIGLLSGAPNLAPDAEDLLQQTIEPQIGWS